MGNQILQTNHQSKELSKLFSRFHILHNDTAKNIIFMQEISSKQQYMFRQITTNDQFQKRCIENLIQKKIAFKCPQLSKLQFYLIEKQKNYCSNQFKTYLLFESYKKNLMNQIRERRNRKFIFDQLQIMKIIQSSVFALKFLDEINHPHEAVCSANIFFNKEGYILISDPWLNQKNIPFSSANHIYFSPQKLDQINNVRLQKVDWFSSDLFSLGIVVLEVINLQFMDQLYFRNNKQLNKVLLKQKINQVQSDTIRRYLKILLLTDPSKRKQIVNQLIKDRNKIQYLKSNRSSCQKQPKIMISSNSNVNLPAIHYQNEINNSRNREFEIKEGPYLIPIKRLELTERKNLQKSEANTSHKRHLKLMINNRHRNEDSQLSNANNKPFLNVSSNKATTNVIKFKTLGFRNNKQNNLDVLKQDSIYVNPQNDENKKKDINNFIKIKNNKIYQQNRMVYASNKNLLNNQINVENNIIPYNPFVKIINQILPKAQISNPIIKQDNHKKIEERQNQSQMINSNSNIANTQGNNNLNSFMNQTTIFSNSICSIQSNLSECKKNNEGRLQNKNQFQLNKSQQIKQNNKQQIPKQLQYNLNENDLSAEKFLLSYEIQSLEQYNKGTQQNNSITTPTRKNKNINKYNSTIQQVSENSCTPNSNSHINESQFVIQQSNLGIYKGFKKNGMKNGKGIYYYQQGGYYQGQWKDNKMHGYGRLFYGQSHLAYEGDWYLDYFHGHGKVYNDNQVKLDVPFDYRNFEKLDQYWQWYEGSLNKDTKQGFGKVKLFNGEIYEGEFHEDKIEGVGKYTTMKGEVINGIWRNCKLIQ